MQETLVQFLSWEDPLEKEQVTHSSILGLPWWLRWQRIHPQWGRPGLDSWVGKIPWRKGWQPTPVFLLGESHGQRNLEGYSPWGRRESDTTERLTTQQNRTAENSFIITMLQTENSRCGLPARLKLTLLENNSCTLFHSYNITLEPVTKFPQWTCYLWKYIYEIGQVLSIYPLRLQLQLIPNLPMFK